MDAWCTARRIRCLYFRTGGSCPCTLALAAAGGFRFVDVRTELSLPLPRTAPTEPPPDDIVVRPATQADLPELQNLAAGSHHDTRFFKDDLFDAARAGDLYRGWIERDFARHHMMVSEFRARPGRPCGYVTCERDHATGEGRIGLIAVAPDSMRRGLGISQVHAAVNWFTAEGLHTAKVVTQGTNVPALRLYETAGFRTSDVSLWFHKWFDEHPHSEGGTCA